MLLKITSKTSLQEIVTYIQNIREEKGKEKEVLKTINESLRFGHDFIINLFWEEALTYQHIYMSDSSNTSALSQMENTVIKAKFYIEKYKLIKWNSRLYRFLGRICDYKKQFNKAVFYYKKAVRLVKSDYEPWRILELEGFLSHSLIMSGKHTQGMKIFKSVHNKFLDSKIGKFLYKVDHNTWAIWLSGIVIRTINAVIDKKLKLNSEETKAWISLVEEEISQKNKFEYRREELERLKSRLMLN